MKHVLAAGAIAACALALSTACAAGSGGSAAGGGASGAGGSSAATDTATAGGGSGSGTGSASAGSTNAGNSGVNGGANNGNGPSTCLVRDLNGSVANEQGTAGSVYVDLVFKNLGSQPCTLYGYPGVSFGAGSPVAQVGLPADRNPAVSSTLVTLQPGGHAYAVLQIADAGNFPSATCQPTSTTYLQVIPPNTSNTLEIAYNATACKGNVVTMHVEAVQPGSGS